MPFHPGWLVGTALSLLSALVLFVPVMTVSAAAPASKTVGAPPSLTVEKIAQGRQQEHVKIAVKGPVQVNFLKITLPPGSSTGKHCHHGQLVAVVHQGTLTHYARVYPGGVRRYTTGESAIEGSGYVHEGRNEGSENVILWVISLTPEGKPLTETDLTRCHRE